MSAVRRLAVLLVSVALGAFPAGASAFTFGFNDGSIFDGVPDAREADVMAGAGAQVHRFTLNWQGVERVPGVYDFRIYDSIYASDLARGVQPEMILLFSPRWAWDRGETCPPKVLCRFPPSERRLGAFKRMVQVTLRRYPRLAGLEIWNEPNLTAFWSPYPDAARYTRLVQAARAAAQEIGSPVPIVAGSLGNKPIAAGHDPNGVDAARFLRGMYRHGAIGAYDALSLHPYPGELDLAWTYRMLVRVDDLRARYGDTTPIWVTEVGASTPSQVDQLHQADLLVRLLSVLGSWPGVSTVLVHTLFPPAGQTGSEAGFAVMNADGTPKPAYCALARQRLRSPMNCTVTPAGLYDDAKQQARWDAQGDLAQAMESATAYGREHGNDLSGFTTPAGDVPPETEPGASANPARVGVYHLEGATLLCNASRADTSYCAMFTRGGIAFGSAQGSIGAAAGATIHRTSQRW